MGCNSLLQGIFPTQELRLHPLCLPHCQQVLYLLSHQGNPDISSRQSIKNIFFPSHGMCSLCYIMTCVERGMERQRLWSWSDWDLSIPNMVFINLMTIDMLLNLLQLQLFLLLRQTETTILQC